MEIETRGSAPAARHIVRADQSELIVLDLSNPQLPEEVRRALLALASGRPESFPPVPGAAPLVRGDVRVAADGVYMREHKVDDLSVLVQRIPRPDVLRITQTRHRGSIIGAVVGAGAGFFVGFVSALNLAFKDCGGDCSDEKVLMGLSLVGLPIAGGTIGYYAFRRPSENVIYRAP